MKEPLDDIQFLADGLRGWAVGDKGTILATTNGGETWTKQESGTYANLFSIAFQPDGAHGRAVEQDGPILTTTDGGQSWTRQSDREAPGRFLNRRYRFLPDGARGWGLRPNGEIVATADGGETWMKRTYVPGARIDSVHIQDDGARAWAVGNHGTILLGHNPLLPDLVALGEDVDVAAEAAYQALSRLGLLQDGDGLAMLAEIRDEAARDKETLAEKTREGDDTS